MNGEIYANIRRDAERSFKDHVITERMRSGVFRSWRCQRPKSWVYGFDITTIPGSLIITGDVGELIVSREYDMLPWCRGSIDSISYFASKVPHAIPTREHSPDRIREYVQELLDSGEASNEQQETLSDMLMMDDFGNYDPGHWYSELSEFYDGGDPPDFTAYKTGFLWCREAIRWFVMKHDEPEVVAP